MPGHYKIKKALGKARQGLKEEYQKSKSRYKSYKSALKLGEVRLRKIVKSPKYKKAKRKARTINRNIQGYFNESVRDIGRADIGL